MYIVALPCTLVRTMYLYDVHRTMYIQGAPWYIVHRTTCNVYTRARSTAAVRSTAHTMYLSTLYCNIPVGLVHVCTRVLRARAAHRGIPVVDGRCSLMPSTRLD